MQKGTVEDSYLRGSKRDDDHQGIEMGTLQPQRVEVLRGVSLLVDKRSFNCPSEWMADPLNNQLAPHDRSQWLI